jgi:hypothetical protein
MRNLSALGKDRKMAVFILSQLNFGQYLKKKKKTYEATVQQLGIPLPKHLDTLTTIYSDGEPDIILFHRLLGILVGEIKAVGRWHFLNNQTEAPDNDVMKRVQKAVQQLLNSKLVISHVIRD